MYVVINIGINTFSITTSKFICTGPNYTPLPSKLNQIKCYIHLKACYSLRSLVLARQTGALHGSRTFLELASYRATE
jgi:hypothetical protein